MAVKHTIRTKSGGTKEVSLTPLSAHRAGCLECMVWVPSEVIVCTDKLCPHYPFRFGTNPARKGITKWSVVKKGTTTIIDGRG